MPVTTDNQCRTGCQSAFDIDVVFWIVQKRPEAKPGGDEMGPTKKRIKHSIDLATAYPRVVTENTFPLHHVLILQCDGR